MWNSIVEEPTHNKKKMSPPSYGLSSLTDDIVLRCLSRVSRSDQPALSRVCKSYRSLVASPELYKTRNLYGCTENFTYVCLLAPPDGIPRWFILSRGGKNAYDRHLSPIPSFPSQAEEGSSVVVLDWGIYILGGVKKGRDIQDVLLLDCRTHTWHRLPSMGIGRCSAATGVVGGKLYVFGGCDENSPNWAECFDPKTQTWVTLPSMPDQDTRYQYIHSSVVVREEKVYAVDQGERTFYYSPSEGKWERGSSSSEVKGIRRDWCVIDKIIYTCDRFGNLCWCEIEQLERQGEEELMNWRKVQGLDSLQEKLFDSRLIHFDWKLDTAFVDFMLANGQNPKLIDWYPGDRLSNSGPNIVVFWDVVIEGDHHDIWAEDYLQIWSAEISLERRRNGTEIWGSIEWAYPVMTVDPFFHRYKIKAKVPCNSLFNKGSRIGYSHFSGKLHPNRRSTFEDVQLFYTLGKELARSRAIWVTCLCTCKSKFVKDDMRIKIQIMYISRHHLLTRKLVYFKRSDGFVFWHFKELQHMYGNMSRETRIPKESIHEERHKADLPYQ